jgi:sulfur-carrier protein
VHVTVRYFAAARAAAGVDSERVPLDRDTTVDDVIGELGGRDSELARVLARCSFLCDGVAVRDGGLRLTTNQTLDVLPPFAGG